MGYTADDITRAAKALAKAKFDNKEEVNHPSHYNEGIEVIDFIDSWNFNFNLGNVIAYVARCEYKGNKKKDIKKAIWYLERELQRESANNE